MYFYRDDIYLTYEYKDPFHFICSLFIVGRPSQLHSTGGTKALLVVESTDKFKAVFSFGPVSSVCCTVQMT